jgi:Fe-S-cluster-containing dehydrogenase component
MEPEGRTGRETKDAQVTTPVDRRSFLRKCTLAGPVLLGIVPVGGAGGADAERPGDTPRKQYGMGVDVDKCIGCGRCAEACKTENNVPREPFFFRTWVERYVINEKGEVSVDSPNGGIDGFPPLTGETGVLRTFFVPKLCNHCAKAPCVQVCPVGATFTTPDGVVLVDKEYCLGCRYCIQACPYGARYLHHATGTAEKCTFCYHRLVKGLQPACVEVCPTGARLFGEVGVRNSPLARFMRFEKLRTLKAHLNTEPRVFYANLDGEVV